jgi:salicylate hydroxylase
MSFRIAVAGAGIGGLTAALALARQGHAVEIYEQSATLEQVGAGIQLSPNATRILIGLGLEAHLHQAGFEPAFAAMRHYQSGRTYFSTPLRSICRDRYGAPYLHVHRADLQALLVAEVLRAGVGLHLGMPISGYAVTATGADLLLADASARPVDLIVGADGVRSSIRGQMLGASAGRLTGHVAWRGVVDASRLRSGLVKPGATVWLGPGRHVVTYFIRGGELVNFAGFQENCGTEQQGWTGRGNPHELQAAYQDWHPEVAELARAVDDPRLWALSDADELSTWSQGAVVLLGDACHPTLPYMAQGAGLAIEDAFMLASLTKRHELPKALKLYEHLRRPRATRLQAMARKNAGLFHLHGFVNRMRLQALSFTRSLPTSLLMRPLDSVYGFDVCEQLRLLER